MVFFDTEQFSDHRFGTVPFAASFILLAVVKPFLLDRPRGLIAKMQT